MLQCCQACARSSRQPCRHVCKGILRPGHAIDQPGAAIKQPVRAGRCKAYNKVCGAFKRPSPLDLCAAPGSLPATSALTPKHHGLTLAEHACACCLPCAQQAPMWAHPCRQVGLTLAPTYKMLTLTHPSAGSLCNWAPAGAACNLHGRRMAPALDLHCRCTQPRCKIPQRQELARVHCQPPASLPSSHMRVFHCLARCTSSCARTWCGAAVRRLVALSARFGFWVQVQVMCRAVARRACVQAPDACARPPACGARMCGQVILDSQSQSQVAVCIWCVLLCWNQQTNTAPTKNAAISQGLPAG